MRDHLRGPYGRTDHVHKGKDCEFVILKKTKEICQWGQKIVMKKVGIKNLRRNCQYCQLDSVSLDILSVYFPNCLVCRTGLCLVHKLSISLVDK